MDIEDVYPLQRVRVVRASEWDSGVSPGDIGHVLYTTEVGARVRLMTGECKDRTRWMPVKNLESTDAD